MGGKSGSSAPSKGSPIINNGQGNPYNLYTDPSGRVRDIYNTGGDDLNSIFKDVNRDLGSQELDGLVNRNSPQLYHDYVTNQAFNNILGQDPTQSDYLKYHGTDVADIPGLLQGQADQQTIDRLGQLQFDSNKDFIAKDSMDRASGRDKLAELLTQQAQNSFARTLPNIAENAQAAHLYDTTGYGQEVARQQAALGQDIASQVGLAGISDINLNSQRSAAGLDALHQNQQAGLNRNLSVQDYINQTRRAKLLGQQAAPQVSGKAGQTSATLSGVGAGATAGSAFGPWGTAIGGAAGGAAGYFGSR